MGLLKRLLGKSPQIARLFVLSLDGVPHSLVLGAVKSGLMPNMGRLLREGAWARMNSVLPAVSTVAWATYMTGVNPGKHGIYGYVEREPNPFGAYIPTAKDLKAPTLWEMISRGGKRLGAMGVPLTYPPKQVNGFMVGCFLSPDLGKATFPVDLATRLVEMEYKIDADLSLARQDMGAFLEDLNHAMERRFAAAFKLMASEPWEFFQLHVMDTDRLNHFLWGSWQDGAEGLAGEFEAFYHRLDSYIGELVQNLPPECRLAILSDHGFTRSQAHVQINHWLEKNGYLLFGRGKKEFMNLHPETKAYSLVPGRVYINLEGREEKGRVGRGKPAEDLRQELLHRLGGIKHPESGQPLIRRVYKREEIYAGPQLAKAADLIIDPMPGCELKANWDAPGLLAPPDLSGAHTYDDAFFYLQGAKSLPEDNSFSLMDMAPTLLGLLGVQPPPGLDGQNLL
ncbi:MAG: alkaline phosphatase family protein [Desulfarculus sp.]|nr:alkaline phosphatase family protein [Desulfarculus sp.]